MGNWSNIGEIRQILSSNHVRFRWQPTGKYYVSILTEYEKESTPKEVERVVD